MEMIDEREIIALWCAVKGGKGAVAKEVVEGKKGSMTLDQFLRTVLIAQKKNPPLRGLKPSVAAANFRHHSKDGGMTFQDFYDLMGALLKRAHEMDRKRAQRLEVLKQERKAAVAQVKEAVQASKRSVQKFCGTAGNQYSVQKMSTAYHAKRREHGINAHNNALIGKQQDPGARRAKGFMPRDVPNRGVPSHEEHMHMDKGHKQLQSMSDSDRLRGLVFAEGDGENEHGNYDKGLAAYREMMKKEKREGGHEPWFGNDSSFKKVDHVKGQSDHVRQHKALRNDPYVSMQLQSLPTHRPYFYYCIAITQAVLMALSIGMAYLEMNGLAPLTLQADIKTCALPRCPEFDTPGTSQNWMNATLRSQLQTKIDSCHNRGGVYYTTEWTCVKDGGGSIEFETNPASYRNFIKECLERSEGHQAYPSMFQCKGGLLSKEGTGSRLGCGNSFIAGSDPPCPELLPSQRHLDFEAAFRDESNPWWGPYSKGLLKYGAGYSMCMREDNEYVDYLKAIRENHECTANDLDLQWCSEDPVKMYEDSDPTNSRTLDACYSSGGTKLRGKKCGSDSFGVGAGFSCCKVTVTEGSSTALSRYGMSTYSDCNAINIAYANPTSSTLNRNDSKNPKGIVAHYGALDNNPTVTLAAEWLVYENSRGQIAYTSGLANAHSLFCDESNSIQMRPCCYSLKGKCKVTTEDKCDFINGTYFSFNQMCSQTMCLGETCNTGNVTGTNVTADIPDPSEEVVYAPANKPKTPNQWQRFFAPMFLSAGLIQFLLYQILQYQIVPAVEENAGLIRTLLIYLGSGIYGAALSLAVVPYGSVLAGPGASIFGTFAVQTVDLLQFWLIVPEPYKELSHQLGVLLVAFVLGLLPMIDNWSHLGGYLIGLPLGILLLPYINLGRWDLQRKRLLFYISIAALILMFVLTFSAFYSDSEDDHETASKFTCHEPFGVTCESGFAGEDHLVTPGGGMT